MRRAGLAALSVVGVVALTAGCTSSGQHATASTTAGVSVAPSIAPASSVPSSDAAASPSPSTAVSTPATPSTHTLAPTTVAAPSPSGNIHETVPSRPVRTEAPVKPGRPGSLPAGVTVTATALKAITAKAHGPGEIGGPAVEVVLKFKNSGAQRVNLGQVVVTAAGSNGDQGLTISGSPADPVAQNTEVAAGSAVTGRYVFTLAKSNRSPVTIHVSYSSTPVVVVVIRGNAAR